MQLKRVTSISISIYLLVMKIVLHEIYLDNIFRCTTLRFECRLRFELLTKFKWNFDLIRILYYQALSLIWSASVNNKICHNHQMSRKSDKKRENVIIAFYASLLRNKSFYDQSLIFKYLISATCNVPFTTFFACFPSLCSVHYMFCNF